jgi:hypothetical protein
MPPQTNAVLWTVFLVVWILGGILYIASHF